MPHRCPLKFVCAALSAKRALRAQRALAHEPLALAAANTQRRKMWILHLFIHSPAKAARITAGLSVQSAHAPAHCQRPLHYQRQRASAPPSCRLKMTQFHLHRQPHLPKREKTKRMASKYQDSIHTGIGSPLPKTRPHRVSGTPSTCYPHTVRHNSPFLPHTSRHALNGFGQTLIFVRTTMRRMPWICTKIIQRTSHLVRGSSEK